MRTRSARRGPLFVAGAPSRSGRVTVGPTAVAETEKLLPGRPGQPKGAASGPGRPASGQDGPTIFADERVVPSSACGDG
ncbi:MAG: hypothetical protein M0017_05310 [Desulfobacteraceae bacterium]|nr:hypothetical protein [Desulfobacteraceae bacterium]